MRTKNLALLLILVLVAVCISPVFAEITSINVTSPNGGEFWSGKHNIEWSATGVTSNNRFDIKYSPDGGSSWSDLTSCLSYSATSWLWNTEGLIDSSNALVQIIITNGCGGSGVTDDFSDSVFTIDNTAPPSVTGLTAESYSDGSIHLSWNSVTDATSGTKQYNIYRSTSSGFTPGADNLLTSTSSTSYTDALSGDEDQTYYYIVRAEDNAGNEETNTNEVSATKDSADRLVYTINPTSVIAGEVTPIYTVEIRGDQGIALKATSDQTVNLTTTSTSATKYFCTNSKDCSKTQVTSITIPQDSSSANFYYYDQKAGNWTITAIRTGWTAASDSLTVNPATLDHFTVTGIPDPVVAGTATSPIVTAYDQYNNIKTDYTGTIHFTSDDAQAVLPSNYTFVSDDKGVHTFTDGVILKTAGEKYVMVTGDSKTGQQSGITVNPKLPSKIVFITPPQTLTRGTISDIITIQTQDEYDNPSNVGSDIQIDLSSTSAGALFSLVSSPWNNIISVTINNGTNSASFYYKDFGAANTYQITANETSLTSASQDVTITAGTATINVPSDFSSIQAAINAASEGDTIEVADGTYSEQLIINKSITLIAKGSNSILNFSAFSGSTKHIVDAQGAHDEVAGIYVNASDVIIEGFHFIGIAPDNMSNQLNSGLNTVIRAYTIADNLTVQNCVFDPPTGSVGRVAITVKWADNLRFLNNEINDYIYGVNLVDENDPIDNALVQGNTFTQTQYVPGYASSGMWFDFCEGVQLWLGDNLQVINNTFIGPGTSTETGNLPSMVAVLDFNNYFEPLGTKTIKVENNTIENYYDGVDTCSNGLIKGNTISNNAIGVYVEDVSGIAPTINYNNIEGNSQYGVINNRTAVTLDAINNWWGSANGPTHSSNTYNVGSQGDKVSDNVDFTLWLNAPYPDGASFAPVMNTNTGEGFASIQAAINAASEGDTIVVYDGIYKERIVINKEITLKAGSTPILDGENIIYGPAVHITADNVTFEGFIIRNYISNNTNISDIGGILIEGNNAIVNNVTVYNIQSDSSNPAGIGIDIHANNVKVTNCTVYDVDSIGIRARYDWNNPPTMNNNITIENNEVYHTGNRGILITGYAKGVTIRNNEIYESLQKDVPYNLFIHYGAEDVLVEGNHINNSYANIVLAGCNNVTIKNNIIENATPLPSNTSIKGKNIYILNDYFPWYDVNALSTNVTIMYNDIINAEGWGIYIRNIGAANPSAMAATTYINYNNIYGNSEYGIENIIPTDVDAKNNWWGHVTGPYSSSSNSDSNADGRGNAVSNNVDYRPWWISSTGGNDVTSPSSQITLDPTTQYVNSLTFNLPYSASDDYGLNRVRLYENSSYTNKSQSIADYPTSYSGSFSRTVSGDGTYTYYTIAVDVVDNEEATPSEPDVTIIVDTTPPTISDNYVNNGTWVNSNQTVTLIPSDTGGSGIKEVKYCTGTDCTPNTPLSSPYQLYYTTTQDTIVRYQAWDNANNPSAIGEYNVKIDKEIPTISDNYVNNGTWVNSNQTVTLIPSDTGGSGIKEVKYCTGTDCTPNTPLSSPYQLYYTTTQDTIVRYQAWDNANNPSAIGEYNVKIDKEIPTTTDNSDTNWHADDQTITLTSADTGGSCVAHTYYCIYNQGASECTSFTEGTSVSVTCPDDSVCEQIVRYYSVDNAGNAETAHNSNVVKIDKKAPSITPITKNATIQVGNSKEISATITDDGSGVKNVTLFYDNGTVNGITMNNIGGNIYKGIIPAQSDNMTITYYITAEDNVGNIEQSDEYTITTYDLVLDLSNDWNYVSVPTKVDRDNISEVFAGSDVWVYNTTINEWVSPTKILPGVGYTVSKHDKVGFNYISGFPILPISKLEVGWNLVGFQTDKDLTINQTLSLLNVPLDGYYYFLHYNPLSETEWDTYAVSNGNAELIFGSPFDIKPGEAYWIWAKTEYNGSPSPQ